MSKLAFLVLGGSEENLSQGINLILQSEYNSNLLAIREIDMLHPHRDDAVLLKSIKAFVLPNGRMIDRERCYWSFPSTEKREIDSLFDDILALSMAQSAERKLTGVIVLIQE